MTAHVLSWKWAYHESLGRLYRISFISDSFLNAYMYMQVSILATYRACVYSLVRVVKSLETDCEPINPTEYLIVMFQIGFVRQTDGFFLLGAFS